MDEYIDHHQMKLTDQNSVNKYALGYKINDPLLCVCVCVCVCACVSY